jgi:hypothetical protein
MVRLPTNGEKVMSELTPFNPKGNATVALDVTGTNQVLTPLTQGNTQQYRVSVIGNKNVFITFGAAPVATLTTSIPIEQNTTEIFTAGYLDLIGVIASGTGSTIYVTAGEGGR